MLDQRGQAEVLAQAYEQSPLKQVGIRLGMHCRFLGVCWFRWQLLLTLVPYVLHIRLNRQPAR